MRGILLVHTNLGLWIARLYRQQAAYSCSPPKQNSVYEPYPHSQICVHFSAMKHLVSVHSAVNIANLVSLLRIALIVPVAGLLIWELPLAALGCFIAASLLDWVDGYLARSLEITSSFGAVLDHSADKLLVGSTLITLVYVYGHPAAFGAALAVIGRDLIMGGLRELWLLEGKGARAAVNRFGKWKTTIQMVALCVVFVLHWLHTQYDQTNQVALLPMWGLWLAYTLLAIISIASLLHYLKPSARHN